jgi:hypothetical protein
LSPVSGGIPRARPTDSLPGSSSSTEVFRTDPKKDFLELSADFLSIDFRGRHDPDWSLNETSEEFFCLLKSEVFFFRGSGGLWSMVGAVVMI